MENNRYNNSKIYKLVDQVNGYFYIGSTCNPLSKRLYWHKNDAKKQSRQNTKVYKYFNEIGWDNVKIVLIQENYLDNKDQLLREEDSIIQMYLHDEKCLNCNRSFVSLTEHHEKRKQYDQNHKEEIKTYKQKYYDKNKNEINSKSKMYYEINKKDILEKQKDFYQANKENVLLRQKSYIETHIQQRKEKLKEWYEKNREKVREYKTKEVKCLCGALFTISHKSRHERTKRHQAFIHDEKQTAETI